MAGVNWGDSGVDRWADREESPYLSNPVAQAPQQDWTSPVRSWYQKYLGRDAESDAAVNSWATLGAAAEQGIANSEEAKAYAALKNLGSGAGSTGGNTGGGGNSGGGSVYDQIRAYQASHSASEGIGPLASALGLSRFMYGGTPSNNEVVVGGQKYKVLGAEDNPNTAYWYSGGDDSGGGGSSGGGAPAGWTGSTQTPYSDQSSNLYLNTLLQRLQALQQPVADPMLDLFKQLALSRAQALQNPRPYTAGEDAAMVARYREPLTQARDAAYARNKEEASRKGFLPSSGLLRRLDTDVSAGYERGIAQGSNDLAVQAVNEKQRQADEALAILGNLVTANSTSRQENEARQREAVTIASLFPQFDDDRLKLLLGASGDSGGTSSLIGNLTQLGNLNLNANAYQNQQSQESSYALAQLLYNIINGIK